MKRTVVSGPLRPSNLQVWVVYFPLADAFGAWLAAFSVGADGRKDQLGQECLPLLRHRLRCPLIRKNGKLERATWDEAMSLVASKFRDTIAKYGPDSVGFYGSGQALTEESYCANKLFKAGIRTNNLEGNPRLCMASAVAGYLTTYGKDEPMGCYEDIDHADVFFIIGSNTAEAHPILFERIVKRQSANPAVKVIVLDPRRTPTSRIANLHISFTPGTDMAILNAMANVLITEKLIDEDFLKTHVAFGEGAEANKTGTITRHSLRNTRRTRQPKSQAAELKTLCGPRTGSATKKPPLCPCGPWA